MEDMKKIGPNLKDVRLKLNQNWIPVWLKKPSDFRPTTKMPNFRSTTSRFGRSQPTSGSRRLPMLCPSANREMPTTAKSCSRLAAAWLATPSEKAINSGRNLCREPYACR